MDSFICRYFLAVSHIFDHPDARDHHIARYLRLVRLSYKKSRSQYAPIKMNNVELAHLWRCNEPAARACLAELKNFGWVDTKQIGQHERLIILKAVWRNDGTDGAEETNAPSISDLHLEAQATATPLPAQSSNDSIAQGANHSSTLTGDPNVVVVCTIKNSTSSINNNNNSTPNQSTGSKGGSRATTLEGASLVSTLNSTPATDCTGVRAVFENAAVKEPALTTLAQTVSEQNARDWCEKWVPNAPQSFTDPVGFMIKRLLVNPNETPDLPRAKRKVWWDEEFDKFINRDSSDEFESTSHAEETSLPYRADGTAELWSEALAELKLQMTKATFDTWIGASRALGWDDATGELVVSVHSPYAKEWLEARLETTVKRTVAGIAGRAVSIRYEVQGK